MKPSRGSRSGMKGSNRPPDDPHPIEKWTDRELIDQYRYLSAELAATDPEYLNSDQSPIAAIEEEIKRRGLDFLADNVQPDPASAGREAEGPVTFPP